MSSLSPDRNPIALPAFDWQHPDQSIPERFATVARAWPDAPAVRDGRRALTFSALARTANGVARAILAKRGAAQEGVALLAGHDATAVAGALGVLCAGDYYIAPEISYSNARVAQLLDHAEARLVLADAAQLTRAREIAGGRDVLCLDELDPSASSPHIDIGPGWVAALNYTSGSTGAPKGVIQSHASMQAQAERYVSAYYVGPGDCVVGVTALAWAGSFWDIFGPLCLGACAAVYDARRDGLAGMPAWMVAVGATMMASVPVTRRLAQDFPDWRFPLVRLVQLGGEPIFRSDVALCHTIFPNAVVAVGLGATETGRISEQFIAPGQLPEQAVVPVGFPTEGVRVRLLTENGDEVRAGDVGEIAVQSGRLSPGYWRLPRLTAERFRREPRYGDEPLYLSGDLGRWLPDGMLQHLGRKDQQVKIRGYQVLLNEVEAALLECPGVREACVAVQHTANGHEQLVAFLRGDGYAVPGPHALRARLADSLPDHMIPSRYRMVDALPKTDNGKIDRRALPDMDTTRPDLDTPYVEARTPFEVDLARIWAEALGIDRVGVRDPFLDLGGDSLQAMQIVSRVIQRFGLELPTGTLFESPTVGAMAERIAAALAHED